MARVTRSRTRTVDTATLDLLTTPRDDVVGERAEPDEPGGERYGGAGATVHRFTQADGPFVHYARTVVVLPPATGDGAGIDTDDDEGDGDAVRRGGGSDRDLGDRHLVRETLELELPPGTWRFLTHRAMVHALTRPGRPGRMPWWAPTQRPDPQGAAVLGVLAVLAMVVSYHGTLLSQTMTFAADEFEVGNTAQGVVLSTARIGGMLAVVLTALADRTGRRRMLRASLLVCIASTVLGAATPNLFGLAATQVVNRGGWAASFVLLGIIVAEEMPAGARAYAVSLLSMTGALGAGMALWVLPVADLGVPAWRVLYALPVLMLPVVLRSCRRLPESRRYVKPHRNLTLAGHRSRLWLLAGATLLLNVFMAPQTQLRNEFLRDERAFSAGAISIFIMVISTPAGIGIVAGGRLAESRGRRVVGAASVALGTALMAASYTFDGPSMWTLALAGSVVFAAHVPALAVYGPELFPTSLRGRANGIISITAMGGSVVGLLTAGALADAFDSFGPTMAIVAAGPLLMALLILLRFPETARRELEEINPEDVAPDDVVPTLEVPPAPRASPGPSPRSPPPGHSGPSATPAPSATTGPPPRSDRPPP